MIPNPEKAREIIEQANDVVIFTHIRPDGDAIGSSLAMCKYLTHKGKKVRMILPNSYPIYFGWIDGIKEMTVFEKSEAEAIKAIKEADLFIHLDHNELGRISAVRPIMENLKTTRIVIDHHINQQIPCDYEYSDPSSPATCEMVYHFIHDLDGEEAIDKKIAEHIMLGIITDTGGLSFSANSPELYRVIAKLMEKGVDKNALQIKAFHTYTKERFALMTYCLQKMEILPDGHTALMALSREELMRYDYHVGDLDSFVNLPLQMTDVNRTVLLREDKDGINISLRSEGDNPVNTIAGLFGGGGHKNAAGCEMDVSLKEAVDRIKKIMR